MLLSLNLGGMSEKQKDWIISWIKKNMTTSSEIEKAAHIAYQYDAPDDLIDRIRAI